MTQTSALTQEEQAILKDRIKQDERASIGQILAFTFFVLLMIFLPGKGNQPSIYQSSGFLWPFIIIYSLMGVIFVYMKYQIQRRLQQDLQTGIKTIEPFPIWRKEKSFAKKEYYIWLDTAEKDFAKFTFPWKDATTIEQATHLVLEYAPKSKIIFKQSLKEESNLEKGTGFSPGEL